MVLQFLSSFEFLNVYFLFHNLRVNLRLVTQWVFSLIEISLDIRQSFPAFASFFLSFFLSLLVED